MGFCLHSMFLCIFLCRCCKYFIECPIRESRSAKLYLQSPSLFHTCGSQINSSNRHKCIYFPLPLFLCFNGDFITFCTIFKRACVIGSVWVFISFFLTSPRGVSAATRVVLAPPSALKRSSPAACDDQKKEVLPPPTRSSLIRIPHVCHCRQRLARKLSPLQFCCCVVKLH